MSDSTRRVIVYAVFATTWGVTLGWWGVLVSVPVLTFFEYRMSRNAPTA